jgi:hypothetical protein
MTTAELLLLLITIAIAAGATALWAIYALLRTGFSEHIKAMQAIYETIRMPK